MSRFGEFTLLESLGSGTTADRFRALHDSLGGPFFLKCYRRLPTALTPALLERADRLIGIRHEGLCPHLGHGDVAGVHFVVSPLLEGVSLSEFLTRTTNERLNLDLGCVLYLLKRIAECVRALHLTEGGHLFTHGAISSEHVLINDEGDVVLCGLTTPRAFSAGTEVAPAFDLVGIGAVSFDLMRALSFRDERASIPGALNNIIKRALGHLEPPLSVDAFIVALDNLAPRLGVERISKDALVETLRALDQNEGADELPLLEPVVAVPEPLDIPFVPIKNEKYPAPSAVVKDPLLIASPAPKIEAPLLSNTEDDTHPGFGIPKDDTPLDDISNEALAKTPKPPLFHEPITDFPLDAPPLRPVSPPRPAPPRVRAAPPAQSPPVGAGDITQPKAASRAPPRIATRPPETPVPGETMKIRSEKPIPAPALDPFHSGEIAATRDRTLATSAPVTMPDFDEVTRPDFALPAFDAAKTKADTAPVASTYPREVSTVQKKPRVSFLADPLAPAPKSSHKDPAINALLRASLIDDDDLKELVGKTEGASVIDIIIAAKHLNEGLVAHAFSKEARVPLMPAPAVATVQPAEDLLRQFPQTFLLSRRVLPLKFIGDMVEVVVANPFDQKTLKDTQKSLKADRIKVRVAERSAIVQRTRELFGQTGVNLFPLDTQSGPYLLVCMGDDEVMSLATRLVEEGFRIEHTPNARAAAEVLSVRHPDAIVCSSEHLGEGDALLRLVREQEELEDLPFIVVGDADDIAVTRLFELGADDHFESPVSHDRLVAKLRRSLARRKRHTPKPMPLPDTDIKGLNDLPDLDAPAPILSSPVPEVQDEPDFAQPTGVMGTLKQMSVSEIVQSLELGRKTAQVELQPHDGPHGSIGFEEGNVVYAECEGELGEEAFFRLAHHAEGFFRIRYGEAPTEKNIDKATTFLLLEAMRIIDESEQ